ncbi:hypothetical protein H6F76_18040 [Leptolyngbya sp. FACHB-321]|uniref:hypothetical protein n=1 Tax=Leptolyngbya sp. FACHB-321 TaxID=2692807 RepID=UPI00168521C8|nr:hypothetical protein [Leptolyngbya sp. FACHB-321]MBD2036911.1 hypothetical protein [Leptolyngbya sp. FACHB-321]
MESKSLEEALLQYKAYLDATRSPQAAANYLNQTKRALARYLLTSIDAPPSTKRKPTKAEEEQVE